MGVFSAMFVREVWLFGIFFMQHVWLVFLFSVNVTFQKYHACGRSALRTWTQGSRHAAHPCTRATRLEGLRTSENMKILDTMMKDRHHTGHEVVLLPPLAAFVEEFARACRLALQPPSMMCAQARAGHRNTLILCSMWPQ